MTKAQALLDEVLKERGLKSRPLERNAYSHHEAICRALEQFEAFRQYVSNAIEEARDQYPGNWAYFADSLDRFILPKPEPDPLVEALTQAFPLSFDDYPASEYDIANFRSALAERGLEIVEVGDE